MSQSIVSFVRYSTCADRLDLFGTDHSGRAAVVRVIGVDASTYRIILRSPDGAFRTHGAAQQLEAELGSPSQIDDGSRRRSELVVEPREGKLRVSLIAQDGGASAGVSTAILEVDLESGVFTARSAAGRSVARLTIAAGGTSAAETGASVSGALAGGESVFGTGERFDALDRRGRTVQIWAVDRWCQTEGNSYVPVPFFFSTAGYGVFLNRFEPCSIDIGDSDPSAWRIDTESAPLDLYLFLHDSPKSILRAYAELTGFAPEPPEWSFGVHVCRHLRLGEFGTKEGIRAMVSEMERHDLPFSSVIIEGWDTYDRETYADLAEITSELHGKGKKVLVYEPCGRFPNFWIEKRAEQNEAQWLQASAREEFMVHDQAGNVSIEEATAHNPIDAPLERQSRFLDLTNPDAISWWKDDVWAKLVRDIGIDGAKIDFCEQVPETDGVYSDGRSPSGMHHLYPVLYNTMMYRYYQEHRGDGGMCLSRGGGIGAQRYPFMWCGDQLREWRFLSAILKAMVSSGLSGIPFMSHDLGGYMPTRDPDNNDEARVFVRGTQLACFSPNMQTHGIVTRPYDFPPEIVDIYRLYSKIHYLLIPYLCEQAGRCCSAGTPLLRHLYLEYPDDQKTFSVEDEYLLGDALLVAPVLTDSDSRAIYFPPGKWRALLDDREVNGPFTEESLRAEIGETPVFVKEPNTSKRLHAAVPEIRSLYEEWKSV